LTLTDVATRNARPSEKPYKLADGKGLYLAVMPEGGKLWRWKYRVGGREKLMAIGKYPEVSLAQAREIHAENRRPVVSTPWNGANPRRPQIAP
jgi:hypothetical protein